MVNFWMQGCKDAAIDVPAVDKYGSASGRSKAAVVANCSST